MKVQCLIVYSTSMVFLDVAIAAAFVPHNLAHVTRVAYYGLPLCRMVSNGDEGADLLRKQASELREQIRKMEETLGNKRPRNYDNGSNNLQPNDEVNLEMNEDASLQNKRVLVVGANGRLGSMVCRYLLRSHPKTEVVACVHYVGENSPTARGYGQLSYEIGAEDGIGSIGTAWSAEDRTVTFAYGDYMKEYNLQNIRLVECELLDPLQCSTICEGESFPTVWVSFSLRARLEDSIVDCFVFCLTVLQALTVLYGAPPTLMATYQEPLVSTLPSCFGQSQIRQKDALKSKDFGTC